MRYLASPVSQKRTVSALDLNAIGATLGLTTMRTKGTIDQIAAKHFSY